MDNNIFTLFIAPYIDSVAIVSIFTCIAHLQLRYERPRSTGNIIGMLLAKEARDSSKQVGRLVKNLTVHFKKTPKFNDLSLTFPQLSASLGKAKTAVTKTTVGLSGTLSTAVRDAASNEIELNSRMFPNIKTIKVGR